MKNKLKLGLGIAVLMVLASCGASSDASKSSSYTSVTPQEFQKLISETKSFNLLDVRSPEEFAMNHLKGATNINVDGSGFNEKIAVLEKDKPVFVYCKSGGRSRKAAAALSAAGYTVKELEGGILKWSGSGLPVEMSAKKYDDGYDMARYNKETTESDLVLVDFHATWCGPCKMMAPHVEVLRNEFPDKLKVIKVDTDKSPVVSQHFSITGIPLIKLYKDGKEVYDKTGYHSEKELRKVLAAYL